MPQMSVWGRVNSRKGSSACHWCAQTDRAVRYGRLLRSATFALLAVGAAGLAQAQGADAKLALARSEWLARRQTWRGVRCELAGKGFMPKGRFSRDPTVSRDLGLALTTPSEDLSFPIQVTLALDFAHNRSKKTKSTTIYDSITRTFAPRTEVQIHDGASLVVLVPRGAPGAGQSDDQYHPDIVRQTESYASGSFFNTSDYPVFLRPVLSR